MPRNPISKSTRLRIIEEAGSRCAVCGHGSPVVLSHIVAFPDGGESTDENLIALCPNCHARADMGEIGLSELREYKKHPWVTRAKEMKSEEKHSVQVQITIDGDFESFDQAARERLLKAISQFLEAGENEIKISRVEQG
jgi:hypothetical protein